MPIDNLRGPRSRRRRRLQEQQQQQMNSFSLFDSSSSSSSSGASNLLWTILLLGLLFCLADVAYILHYIDKQQQNQQNPPQSFPLLNTSIQHKNPNNKKQESNWFSSILSVFRRDGTSGLSAEELRVMVEQLHQHESELLNFQKQTQVVESEPPSDPLTPEEMATLRHEKKPILDILKQAKVRWQDLDPNILRDLPKWSEVTKLYGDEPQIYGLDQCQAFQEHSAPYEHFVSTAGTFNSGTNLMAELLIANCHMQPRMDQYGASNRGVRWQVPWGKHTPPGDTEFRLNHKTKKDSDVNATNILSAVTIRDPYVWMKSMCKIEYSAHWHHDPHRHCPNLIPDDADLTQFGKYIKEGRPIPVHVRYSDFWKHHDSLVGMWNDWYREYWEPQEDLYRVMVRYEDLLFFPKQVTEAVCHCAGGSLRRDGTFTYIVSSAKKGLTAHGPMEQRTGLIRAMIQYGKATHRTERYTPADLEYARQHLDPELMQFFHYRHPK